MEEEIKINDKVYVLKNATDERNIGIMDAANVSMLFFVDQKYLSGQDEEIMSLPKPKLTFKKNGTLDDFTMNYNAESIKSKQGTKISRNVVKLASVIVKQLTYDKATKEINFVVFEGWDVDTKEWKKDYPIVLLSGNYGILVAPRVDNE